MKNEQIKIEVKNVSKFYNKAPALDNISFIVEPASIYGIIGENGAGKTTLLHCLNGILKPDKGKALYNGVCVYDNPEIKKNIGYVADSNQYFNYYTVKQILEFFSGIYPHFSKKRFGELNEVFRLAYEKRILQLSKGMQMRLALMLNLSIEPKVLILDEPTSGLDAMAKEQVLEILANEVESRSASIIISSHHLSELDKLCDKVAMLQNGKLLYDIGLDSIKTKVRKIQAVFNGSPSIDKLSNIIGVNKIGSIYYLITDNFKPELITELKAMGAIIAEESSMSLEEIFIHLYRKDLGGVNICS